MARVPHVSGVELVKRLETLGYVGVRTVGSHVRLRHAHRPPTTVPLHDVIGPPASFAKSCVTPASTAATSSPIETVRLLFINILKTWQFD